MTIANGRFMAIANGRFAVIFSLRFVAYTEASDAVHVTGFSRPSDRAHEWSRSAKPRPMKRPPNFSGIKPKSKFEEIVTVQAPRLRRPPARERRSKLQIGSAGAALSVSTVRDAASIFVLRSGCRPPRSGSVCLRLSLLSRLAPPLTPPTSRATAAWPSIRTDSDLRRTLSLPSAVPSLCALSPPWASTAFHTTTGRPSIEAEEL
jgi:hypothetical protein